MKPVSFLALAVISTALAQDSTSKEPATEVILGKLRNNPGDIVWLRALTKRSEDPRVIPALRDAFVQAKLSDAKNILGQPASVAIALALYKLGVRENMYFEEVGKHAREAIADDPPEVYLTDAAGKEDATRRNPLFEAWCSNRSLDFQACTKRFLYDVADVDYLSSLGDRRAIPILRSGLFVVNGVMVSSAVVGLAMLNDASSIPAIAQACEKSVAFSANIAIAAMEFNDSRVLTLFDRFLRDASARDNAKTEWRAKHAN